MAAGQGFKTFTSGDVLTAADVNGYLMQGVNVFADATERDAEITSPQEGQFAYLKDTNVTTYYTGSAWTNLDTTGMVNPMTTTGDTIYSSSGSTPARLGIGSTGQVLTVAGGVPTWANAGGAEPSFTLLNTGGTALTGSASTTISFTAYNYLAVFIDRASINDDTAVELNFRWNNDSGTNYRLSNIRFTAATSGYAISSNNDTSLNIWSLSGYANSQSSGYISLSAGKGAGVKPYQFSGGATANSPSRAYFGSGLYLNSSTVTGITIFTSSGNFDGGTVYVYGAN